MSAKQLKKMQQQQQLERERKAAAAGPLPDANDDDEDNASAIDQADSKDNHEEEEEEEEKPKGKVSAFALLNDSDSENDDDEEVDDQTAGKQEPATLPARAAPQPPPSQGESSKAKKKKQKQKKKAGRGAPADRDGEDDEVNALLEQYSAGQDEQTAAATSGPTTGRSCVLSMNKGEFSAEKEERRMLDAAGSAAGGGGAGGGGAAAGQQRKMAAAPRGQSTMFAHHRRLFIVTPDQSQNELWPRPEHTATMVLAGSRDDGTPIFDIRSSKHHERARRELAEAQLTHDPEELQFFLSQEPFCIEALLVVADLLRGQGDHEAYFKLMRRLVYSIECSFEAGFSPFAPSRFGPNPEWPRVGLHLPERGSEEESTWPGWAWLAGLSQYMLALTSRGLHLTAQQVCKLVLAMTLPRDPMHLLICLDALCLRSSRLDFLFRLVRDLVPDLPTPEKGLCRTLDCLLPNFAFSNALALRRKAGSAADSDLAATLNLISVSDVIPPELQASPPPSAASELEPEALPLAALMRALLLFPQVLVPLLEGAAVQMDARPPQGSPYQQVTWRELLTGQPFAGANTYRHKQHYLAYALMSGAYGAICGPLWRGDATLSWLHGAAVRLQQMFGSSLFAQELNDARERWRDATTALDPALQDYSTFNLAEVGPERLLPRVVQQALERPLHEERMASFAAGAAGGDRILPDAAAAVDEDELLRRALEASQREQEASERRRLVEEQDAEYHASLQADRARENGLQPASTDVVDGAEGKVDQFDEEVSQLAAMGFDAAAARSALQACGGNIAAAAGRLLA